ncbi:TetR/AcrR family transcriptional regulator C-terminal domain-containing protein [Streptomyces sp. NBC_01429]|uniref:TetR/AcrR family transcriptional regulator C-terminal domain-containing protein n=1 Tax=Streptomyces sp. NBC_01429 TaxID=2903862 RepID=UPI002E2A22E5|nr:TetR/AcrR family transcriptional regulator C-terminal domain-containing protein [Streptomyces sp. NBC_01429]
MRSGARSWPDPLVVVDLGRVARKMDFLLASGLPERDAQMAMLTASRFTVGSALEEQAEGQTEGRADTGTVGSADDTTAPTAAPMTVPTIDHESAFEAGMALILDGLARRAER